MLALSVKASFDAPILVFCVHHLGTGRSFHETMGSFMIGYFKASINAGYSEWLEWVTAWSRNSPIEYQANRSNIC